MWDKQGVLRGSCSCGECQEFMSGDRVRCDYCDCSPIKHEKIHTLDASNSADFSKITFKSFPEPPDAFNHHGVAASLRSITSNLHAQQSNHDALLQNQGFNNNNNVTSIEHITAASTASVSGRTEGANLYGPNGFSITNEPTIKREENEADSLAKLSRSVPVHVSKSAYDDFDTLDEIVTVLNTHNDKNNLSVHQKIEVPNDDTILQHFPENEAFPDEAVQNSETEIDSEVGTQPVSTVKSHSRNTSKSRKRKSKVEKRVTPRAKKTNTDSILSMTCLAFQKDHGKSDTTNCTIAAIDHSEPMDNESDDELVVMETSTSRLRRNKKKLSETSIRHNTTRPDTPYECPDCGRLFSTNKRAQRHLMREHTEYKYGCVFCNVFFRHKSAALRHKKLRAVDIGANTPRNAPINIANITNDASLNCDNTNMHKANNQRKSKKLHLCLKCEQRFTSRSDLRTHTKLIHVNNPHQCSQCSKTFRSKLTVRKHELQAHTVPQRVKKNVGKVKVKKEPKKSTHKCTLCEEVFQTRRLCKQHEKESHTQEQFQCAMCSELCMNEETLMDHIEAIHTAEDTTDVTDDQPDATDDKHDVIDDDKYDEIDAMKQESGGTCSHCGKEFTKVSLLRRHINTVHSDQEYLCQYCDKQYRRKHDLIIHERLHTGQRPFTCTVCAMTFRSKNNLQSHQVVHDMRGAYQCQYCGRRFDSKHGMLHHERSHTGEKPYECTICNKRFAHRCVLICHERVHSGERPFICKFCERGFKDQSTLRKHVRIHTLEKPYKCSYCDRAFNQKWYVKVHEKCHTGGTTSVRKERKQRTYAPKSNPTVTSQDIRAIESPQIVSVSNEQMEGGTSCGVTTLAVLTPALTPSESVDLTSQQLLHHMHLGTAHHPQPQNASHIATPQILPHHTFNNLPQAGLQLDTQNNHNAQHHVMAHNHGNASMGAVHHHSMIEIMGQSLETLEQQYNVAQRLFSGYLNTLPPSVLGASASGGPADGSCSTHMPF